MFPQQIMDRLLKLKLEMVYRGMPIEQVRQRFEELKQTPPPTEVKAVAPVKRKLRIVNK